MKHEVSLVGLLMLAFMSMPTAYVAAAPTTTLPPGPPVRG